MLLHLIVGDLPQRMALPGEDPMSRRDILDEQADDIDATIINNNNGTRWSLQPLTPAHIVMTVGKMAAVFQNIRDSCSSDEDAKARLAEMALTLFNRPCYLDWAAEGQTL